MFNQGKLSNNAGLLPNFSKQEKNENIQNLSKKNKIELEELQERQLKLLSNKSRLFILPDKGKRIKDFLIKIEKELLNRNKIDEAAQLFSELNIASKGQKAMNKMEWNGKYMAESTETVLDSDDEEDIDPLKLISQSRDSAKIIKIVEPEPSLITENDIKEIESFKDNTSTSNLSEFSLKDKTKFQKIQNHQKEILAVQQNNLESNLDPHVGYVCSKEFLGESKLKYKPYFTTKTNVHDPEKEKLHKKNYKWEITAATPPLFVHSEAQVLTLHDSIELQIKQTETLKVILEEQASERLLKRSLRDNTDINVSNTKATEFFRHYREVNDTSESESDIDEFHINSDDEVPDECDVEEGGTVNIFN